MMATLRKYAEGGSLNETVCAILEEGILGRTPRDVNEAARQIAATIRYRLVTYPATTVAVQGLTDALLKDLATNLADGIEEFGRRPTDES